MWRWDGVVRDGSGWQWGDGGMDWSECRRASRKEFFPHESTRLKERRHHAEVSCTAHEESLRTIQRGVVKSSNSDER